MKLFELLIKEDFRSKYKEFTSDGINPDTVKYYLNTFRKIKEKNPTAFKYTKDLYALESIPLEKRNDIDQYKTFYALESVVDFLLRYIDLPQDNLGYEIVSDNLLVHEDQNVKIFRALSPKACVEIKNLESEGKSITWCVAKKDTKANQYYYYRTQSGTPTFYFVKKKNKQNNKYDFFVIQVLSNGSYKVTSSDNDGDINMSWETIIGIAPELTNLKNVFIHIDFTEQEKLSKVGLTDYEYIDAVYNTKKLYIQGGNTLSDRMFEKTPPDLIELYIRNNNFLTVKQEIHIEENYPKINKFYKNKTNKVLEGKTDFIKELFKLVNNILIDDEQLDELYIKYNNRNNEIKKFNLEYNDEIHIEFKNISDIFYDSDVSYDEYAYIESYTSTYGYNEEYVDKDEYPSVFNYFDTDSQKIFIEICEILYPREIKLIKRYINDLNHENIEELFSLTINGKHSNIFDRMMDDFVNELSMQISHAKTAKANEMLVPLNNSPIDINSDKVVLHLDGLFSFIFNKNINANGFTELIIAILDNVNLDGYLMDDLYNYYEHFDGEPVTSDINSSLENILSDLNDDDSDMNLNKRYIEYINKKLDEFKMDNSLSKESELYIIEITNLYYNQDEFDGENYDNIKIEILLKNKKTDTITKHIIKLNELPVYLYNYKLFEKIKKLQQLI
jgi:hypothetical protein